MRISIQQTLILMSFVATITWGYSGGTGEPNDPYQIATVQDLIDLGNEPNDYNDCFILTTDMDLTDYSFDQSVIAPDEDDVSTGFQGTSFSGFFDGQSHIISNLTIKGAYYLGLFGHIASGASISNLRLESIDVSGAGNNVGGLAGYNGGTITSSYSNGSVSASRYCVGGLVGYNGGTIISSYSNGSVSGTGQSVGGLVGENHVTVTSSYSIGSVSGIWHVGGLVGENYGTITSSYSTGLVSGDGDEGGLVGNNYGSIVSSFWDIETSSLNESEGGIGLTTVQMHDPNTFLNAGWDSVGETTNGICDYWLEQEGNYPCLAVFSGLLPDEPFGNGTVDDPYLITDVNDLGALWYRPCACYRLDSDIDLTGINWNSAVVPGFCGQFNGNGHLIRNLRIEGEGYLGLFGRCASGAVISNLGLVSVDVNGLGNYSGSGDYSGGLAGYNGGTIMLSYSTGSVSGSFYSDGIGGLVGDNSAGVIMSSYSTTSVSGNFYTGGLVGINYEGTITACYSNGSVCGDSCVGGLVGGNENEGAITSCYSNGSVAGNGHSVGGLVGYNNSAIMWSYSVGMVTGDDHNVSGFVGANNQGTIMSSFWDVDTSGWSSSSGGTGLTTSQMKDIDTYLDAGWDFENETINGTEDTWFMPIRSYPGLSWSKDQYPTMSDVIGLDAQEAQAVLIDQGHSVTITYQFSNTIPDGQVISQTVEYVGDSYFEASVTLVVSIALNGMGTLADPYQIANTRQLIHLGETPDLYDQCFVITENLDLFDTTFEQAVIAPDMDEDSSIFDGLAFSGSLNGQGHVISHLAIQGTYNLGLFGYCSSESTIFNLSLESVDVNGTDDRIGALVAQNSGSIMNCQSNGSICGDSSVGGLVGYNLDTGTISWCHTGGTVTGKYYTNSIAGKNEGNLTECSSTAIVDGSPEGGGRR